VIPPAPLFLANARLDGTSAPSVLLELPSPIPAAALLQNGLVAIRRSTRRRD